MTTEVEGPSDMQLLKELMDKPIRTELTRRDHFAIAAMASLLQPPRPMGLVESHKVEWFAEMAYAFADAMEKVRAGS